jgi:hypothetical protein
MTPEELAAEQAALVEGQTKLDADTAALAESQATHDADLAALASAQIQLANDQAAFDAATAPNQPPDPTGLSIGGAPPPDLPATVEAAPIASVFDKIEALAVKVGGDIATEYRKLVAEGRALL